MDLTSGNSFPLTTELKEHLRDNNWEEFLPGMSSGGLEQLVTSDASIFYKSSRIFVLPAEEYDYDDMVSFMPDMNINLKVLTEYSILGGPTVYVYSKINEAEPAYAFYHYGAEYTLYIIKL